MPKPTKPSKPNGNGVALGIEQVLWEAADRLRGHLDAADYKSVVLGLIFLKYISDVFEQVYDRVRREGLNDPEDRDVYLASRTFWVPRKARWQILQDNARQETIGNLIDTALEAIERDNPSLRGMLPGNYGRPDLDKRRLGDLVDLVSNRINFADEDSRRQDTIGRVYEYFLSRFASQEGRKGGEFYTPRSVVRVLVEVLAPYRGRVFDPCCGSGGMFVQSEKFVEAHGGRFGDISIYGQESNPNTFKLAKMNLAIRGIEANLGKQPADSFHADQHPDLKADFVLANPPFNMKEWGGDLLRGDKRWKYGPPPAGNANFAWIQHFIYHLAPGGMAGFVMANGSMSSNTSGEGQIRKAIIEDGLVDCMVALPAQLFYSAQIPVCLWFLSRDRQGRQGHTLFIDARKLGTLTDRVHRDLSDAEIDRIAGTYHAWVNSIVVGAIHELPLQPNELPLQPNELPRQPNELPRQPNELPLQPNELPQQEPPQQGQKPPEQEPPAPYADIPGFCRSVSLDEIRAQGWVLTPGRYVGAAEAEDDGEPFAEKMSLLIKELTQQFSDAAALEKQIIDNLENMDYEG